MYTYHNFLIYLSYFFKIHITKLYRNYWKSKEILLQEESEESIAIMECVFQSASYKLCWINVPEPRTGSADLYKPICNMVPASNICCIEQNPLKDDGGGGEWQNDGHCNSPLKTVKFSWSKIFLRDWIPWREIFIWVTFGHIADSGLI